MASGPSRASSDTAPDTAPLLSVEDLSVRFTDGERAVEQRRRDVVVEATGDDRDAQVARVDLDRATGQDAMDPRPPRAVVERHEAGADRVLQSTRELLPVRADDGAGGEP